MREIVYPDTEEGSSEFKTWLAHHHGHEPDVFPAGSYGYGVAEDGEIIFAVVLEAFHHPGDFLAHLYGADPTIFFERGLMKRMMELPFSSPFNARRVTLMIHRGRDRIIRVAKIFGFEEEGVMRGHFIDDDAVILGHVRQSMEA